MRVCALYRHPIKSHGREAIETVTLLKGQTMPWDRTWAVSHDSSKFDRTAPVWAQCRNFMLGSRTPGLAGIWAKLDEEARQVTLTHQDLGEITICPDNPEDVAEFLAWVLPLCPPDRPQPVDIVAVEGRGMTDSPYPSISIMNTASHMAVADELEGDLAIERWRGNIWLEGPGAWEEFGWILRDLRVGNAVLRVREPIRRCMATAANPQTGQRDKDTLGVLNNVFGHQDFGIYAEVIEGGEISIGDEAKLI